MCSSMPMGSSKSLTSIKMTCKNISSFELNLMNRIEYNEFEAWIKESDEI